MTTQHLRARGEIELETQIRTDRDVVKAFEQIGNEADAIGGARRRLLGTSVRLTREMAPGIHEIVDRCRKELALDDPIELYVYPSPTFNAAAVRPERGVLFVMFSSSLLEGFDEAELAFVVGHELGHHVFGHHELPVGVLLRSERVRLRPSDALRLFAWQRFAEISCDRAGLVCAGDVVPAGRAMFKLASGLKGDRINVRVDQFMAQVGELRDEVGRLAAADAPARSDWFSTHPFSPLRLRALRLFADSDAFESTGSPIDQVEREVSDLMGLMLPSYLQERSGEAEAMRRLLFAGGVLMAAAGGEPGGETLAKLEELLGEGAVSPSVSPEALRKALDRRIADVLEQVAPLRRVQILRDLCLIAQADGAISPKELAVMRQIGKALDVGPEAIACALPKS